MQHIKGEGGGMYVGVGLVAGLTRSTQEHVEVILMHHSAQGRARLSAGCVLACSIPAVRARAITPGDSALGALEEELPLASERARLSGRHPVGPLGGGPHIKDVLDACARRTQGCVLACAAKAVGATLELALKETKVMPGLRATSVAFVHVCLSRLEGARQPEQLESLRVAASSPTITKASQRGRCSRPRSHSATKGRPAGGDCSAAAASGKAPKTQADRNRDQSSWRVKAPAYVQARGGAWGRQTVCPWLWCSRRRSAGARTWC